MTETTPPTIYGGPTKRFFVSMLTRDIELGDAILDLIDNCVDGAMRQNKDKLMEPTPFAGFYADLVLSSDKFSISDNCGGIPADYVEDAFSLGRPNISKDGDLPTIGMYGIGMKRAIFKIGDSAVVSSNSEDGYFSVAYSSDWLDPANEDWDLPINREPKKAATKGVTIQVDDVKPEIGTRFKSESFENTLKIQISEHYGYLMQRGFQVRINGDAIKPSTLQLFDAEIDGSDGIRAFDFQMTKDEVSVKVTVGLFRRLSREAELDEETVSPVEQDSAGISVICNDRVVLLSDKTMKTGWGDGTVPRYHPQFRAIAGLVIFTSNNAAKLPISTTKRDLDVSSEIFLIARKEVMDGIKTFTNFTNKWKGVEESADDFFAPKQKVDAKQNIKSAEAHGQSIRGLDGARKYVPNLPQPVSRVERKRISFLRDQEDIARLSKHLFGDSSQHPSLVGGECFDRALADIK